MASDCYADHLNDRIHRTMPTSTICNGNQRHIKAYREISSSRDTDPGSDSE